VLFSTFYRVKAYWRNDQKALIAPMTDGSVAALDNELADHPFLIQFAYQSSPDPNVNVLRFRRRSRKIELLLSVLLVVTIRGSRFSSRGWVLSQEEGGEALQSTWTDLGYASGVDLNGSEWLSTDGWTRLREANPKCAQSFSGPLTGSSSQLWSGAQSMSLAFAALASSIKVRSTQGW